MNKLTIFWGDKNAQSFRWYIENSKNIEQTSKAIHDLESKEILKADLNVLADMADGASVRLVISSNDVHINQVDMPNKAQRHLRKAVPFLLEEQLAESVDDVFIAIGERLKNQKTPVRAISSKYFKQILKQFESAEIKLASVTVDTDLLATPEEGYQVAFLENYLLLKQDNEQCWSCNQSDFSWLVQKQLADDTEDELPIAIPMNVVCDDEEAYTLFENQLPVGRFAPHMQLVESVEQSFLATQQPSINLLQGEFEPKVENSPLQKMLIKVASIAALILVTHIAYQGSQWVSLEQQKSLLGKERNALWKQAFPSRQLPSNPDKSLRSFLKTLSGADGESSFLALLQSTTTKINNLERLYPTNISYDASRNELRMDLIAIDLPILNQYRDVLSQSGHQVEMSSATQRGDGYSSRLIIRK